MACVSDPTRTAVLEGWLFDVYPDAAGMVVWLLDAAGRAHRLRYPYAPTLYMTGSRQALEAAHRVLDRLAVPVTCTPVLRRDLMSGREVPVVAVTVGSPVAYPTAARMLGRVPGLTLYTCDIATPRLFWYETGLFPLARCAVVCEGDVIRDVDLRARIEDLEYDLPPLTILRIRPEDVPDDPDLPAPHPGHRRPGRLEVGVDGDTVVCDGDDPAELVRSLQRMLQRYDPDIILTEWGDAVLLPGLLRAAAQVGERLALNRDPDRPLRVRRPRSYVTYGRVVHQAGARMLAGRWHLDLRNSFIYAESELAGLLEVARLACMPVQDLARTSTGTAISSMQLRQAVHDGILIPWRKSEPEEFKTASQLLLTDKGGLTYQPLVGLYEQVGELDFSSMYPTLMATYNISPETVGCGCCPQSRIPEIGVTVCRQRRGLVPRVLDHLLVRRRYYRQRARETTGAQRAVYDQRQTALKWCLVTCLDGETPVLHRRAGRWRVAAIGDVVDEFLPGQSWGVRPVQGVVVAGIDHALRLCPKRVAAVIKAPTPPTMVRVTLEGGRQLTMIAEHECYILDHGRLALTRADRLAPGARVPVAVGLEDVGADGTLSEDLAGTDVPAARGDLGAARVLSVETVASTGDFVYCVRLRDEPAGFFVGGGILTHNSFGYLGYRNARFGRIEAHEAVTACAREMLLRAKETAESRGFRMLHALVDSLWLHRPGATRADYEDLARAVSQATGLPITVEGVYRWIAFLPSRTHPGVGVPNRYLGVFADGATKVRGIEARRSDMPVLVVRTQERMLRRLFRCPTLADARAALPEVLDVLKEALLRLRAGEVTAADLVITTRLSQEVHQYRQNTAPALTARALNRAGVRLSPGEAVQYLIADADARVPEDRVRPYGLRGDDWHYDADAYATLLLRAAATVLEPFGYPEQRLRREVWEPFLRGPDPQGDARPGSSPAHARPVPYSSRLVSSRALRADCPR